MIKNKEKGFSLAELGIAMVIMLILATIGTIAYFTFIDNTKEVKVVENAKKLNEKIATEVARYGNNSEEFYDTYTSEVNYQTEIKPEVKEVLEYHINEGKNLIGTVFTNDVFENNGEKIIGELRMKEQNAVASLFSDMFSPMVVNADELSEMNLEVRKINKNKIKDLIQTNLKGEWYIVVSQDGMVSNTPNPDSNEEPPMPDEEGNEEGNEEGEQISCTEGYTCITTVEELDNMRNDLSGNYMLMNNLDLSSFGNWNPIDEFTGVFDGNGYVISNLTINDENHAGFFGKVNNATIKNIGLENVNVNGLNGVGGLTGILVNSTVSDSYVTGYINGNMNVGGLIGGNWEGSTVSDSYVNGRIEGSGDNIGGLVGQNLEATIINSYATGNVTGSNNLGGLVAENNGKIKNSYSSSTVSGNGGIIGGLVANNLGEINNSYSIGDVNGVFLVSGLVGLNSSTVSNSYWNIETSGFSTSEGGIGLTDSEMKQQSSYEGWNFDTVWTIDEGNGYPTLR